MGEMWRVKHTQAPCPTTRADAAGIAPQPEWGSPLKPRYIPSLHVWHPVCGAAPLRRRQTRARHDAGARL